jgi:hypothetical protein
MPPEELFLRSLCLCPMPCLLQAAGVTPSAAALIDPAGYGLRTGRLSALGQGALITLLMLRPAPAATQDPTDVSAIEAHGHGTIGDG